MADVHHLLSRALENRGQQFDISWNQTDGTIEYRLTVQANQRGGDAEWRMFTGTPPAQPELLWTYISCDVLLVYNLVVSSCGDSARAVQADGAITVDQHQAARHNQAYLRLDGIKTQDHITAVRTDIMGSPIAPTRANSALTGDLSHVQMPALLQSILMAKMTGLLKIESNSREAEVYFSDGVPVHAIATDTTGEESIFELLTWKEGNFHFEPKRKSEARTIKTCLDALLLQGMQLIDNAAYLRNAGLRPEAVLTRKHKNLSEKDFESIVGTGTAIPLATQKKFYSAIDDRETIQGLLEKLRLPRSAWIPTMCNMLRCDLVDILHTGRGTKLQLEPKKIDTRAIQNVMMSLRSPETAMFTYPAFLYFLEQEYFRAYRSGSPISVLVFQMRIYSANLDPVRESLPLKALNEAVRRISRIKRHVDLLAHYETFDYAMLLPNTKAGGAEIFANRVVKALMAEPLLSGQVDQSNLSVAFGIASIPEDFLELGLVLSGAEAAKNLAIHSDDKVVLYRDINAT